MDMKSYYYCYYYYFITANRFLPGGSVTISHNITIRHNTQIPISHKITQHAKKNTARKATQIIREILRTMSKMQKEIKAIPVTGRGGCEMSWIPHCLDNESKTRNSYVFWDITSYSPLKINRFFRGTGHFHLQVQRISQARNHREAKLAYTSTMKMVVTFRREAC
jgi:hypothetical protein